MEIIGTNIMLVIVSMIKLWMPVMMRLLVPTVLTIVIGGMSCEDSLMLGSSTFEASELIVILPMASLVHTMLMIVVRSDIMWMVEVMIQLWVRHMVLYILSIRIVMMVAVVAQVVIL